MALSSIATATTTQPIAQIYSSSTQIYTYPVTEWVEYIQEKATTTEMANLTLEIIKRESGGWPDAKNASSTASGLFQFLDSTYETYCIDKYKLATSTTQKNDPIIQIDCGLKLLEQPEGWKHWSESLL